MSSGDCGVVIIEQPPKVKIHPHDLNPITEKLELGCSRKSLLTPDLVRTL